MPKGAIIFEALFNVVYMFTVWGLVVLGITRAAKGGLNRRRFGWLLVALVALALGDSFHVIPRTWLAVAPHQVSPETLAFGNFASSFTLVFFYLALQFYAWRTFELEWDWKMWLMVAFALARLIIIFFPQNDWGNLRTPWKFYRNIPFVLQGAGVVWLFFKNAPRLGEPKSRWLRNVAWGIIVSFACYIATLIGTWWSPVWGVMMVPKTVAYIYVAVMLYKLEFTS